MTQSHSLRRVIAILILLTTIRFMVVSFLPSLQMFGDPNPDAWIGPWGADTVLGLLAPLMVWRGQGLGACDYSNGLLTQWLEPTVTQSTALTYGYLAGGAEPAVPRPGDAELCRTRHGPAGRTPRRRPGPLKIRSRT